MNTRITISVLLLFGLTAIVLGRQDKPGELSGHDVGQKAAEFVKMCDHSGHQPTTTSEAMDEAFCIGFFRGYLDAKQFSTIAHKRNTEMFCEPDGVNGEQLRKIFLKWMNDHPESLHEDSDLMLLASLMRAFPCKEITK